MTSGYASSEANDWDTLYSWSEYAPQSCQNCSGEGCYHCRPRTSTSYSSAPLSDPSFSIGHNPTFFDRLVDPLLLHQSYPADTPFANYQATEGAIRTDDTSHTLDLDSYAASNGDIPVPGSQNNLLGHINSSQFGVEYNPQFTYNTNPSTTSDMSYKSLPGQGHSGRTQGYSSSHLSPIPNPKPTSTTPSQTTSSTRGSGSFRCDHCTKRFHRKNELTRHLKQVAQGPQFVCDIANCTKRFDYEKDLIRHQDSAAHHNARRFFCSEPDCDFARQGFGRKDNYRRHMFKQHGIAIR